MGEPYVKVPLSVVHAKLSPEAKWMLVLLANHRNMNGDSFLTKSIPWYKDSLNLTEWEVKKALKELEEKGLIDKKPGCTNSYRLSNSNELYPENTSGYSENTSGYPENTSGYSENTSGYSENTSEPYIYKNKIKKLNIKGRGKSARAHTHRAPSYDSSLFTKSYDEVYSRKVR